VERHPIVSQDEKKKKKKKKKKKELVKSAGMDDTAAVADV
jgi:hypothetical protein